ncbi:hypothetical protein M758_11G091900 [Ceratodon purpureus]|nr:hypothetical protein M758_11G091900 [Ceratodon purpureus]
MSTSTITSADQVLYKHLKYRPAAPLEHKLQCLDVLVRSKERLPEKLMAKVRGNMRPLMRIGSMLDVGLMGESAQWRSVDDSLRSKQEGLADLQNFTIKRPSQNQHFQKTTLPTYNFSCAASKGAVIWLSGFAGIDLGHEDSLSCCMDGLVAASVDYMTVSQWIDSGEWCPNIPVLQKRISDWSQDHRSKVRKLWIVTEVLYATKFTLTGKSRLSDRVMAKDPTSQAGVDFGIRRVNEKTLELKANRNKHFIVGYRTMRVEYDLDGNPVLFRKSEDTGLRGDDDDPKQLNLVAMEEDMFEDDQDGGKVLIPLLTPAEHELVELFSSVADSSVAERGSSSVY